MTKFKEWLDHNRPYLEAAYKALDMEGYTLSAWGLAQPQWQPIETAPIGIWCLFLDGRGTMDAARYGHAVHVDKVLQKADNEPIHETFYNYYHNYTHWMPLPEAPQGDEK